MGSTSRSHPFRSSLERPPGSDPSGEPRHYSSYCPGRGVYNESTHAISFPRWTVEFKQSSLHHSEQSLRSRLDYTRFASSRVSDRLCVPFLFRFQVSQMDSGGTGHFPRHSLSAIQSRRDTAHSGQLTSHRQHTLTGSAMFIASRPSSGIGSQRVTKKHFSNYPSPNRTCHFHGIRLSSWLEVWTIVTTRPPVAPYFLPSTVAFRHTSGKVLSQLTRLSHFAL